MAFEETNGLGVLASYGVRTPNQKRGAEIGDEVVKHVMFEIDASKGEAPLAAVAVDGLDYVIPKGASLVSCRIVVEEAFNTLTLLTVGTYKATDGTTAIDADGLASTALATIDAKGDVVVGAGPQLTTGTGAAAGALQEAAVIRTLSTGGAATLGKARVYVTYLAPATLPSAWPA